MYFASAAENQQRDIVISYQPSWSSATETHTSVDPQITDLGVK